MERTDKAVTTPRTLARVAQQQLADARDARAARPVTPEARRRVERVLQHAYGEGTLGTAELERRMDLTLAARTTTELRRATHGLRTPEPDMRVLRAKVAGLSTVVAVAVVTWITLLAGTAVLWALGAGPAIVAIIAVAVTAIMAVLTAPAYRARRRLRGELEDLRETF